MFKKLISKNKILLQNSGTYLPRKQKEILKMCRKCYSFKYENKWHFDKPDYLLEKDADEEISVQFSQCPSCVEEALAIYDMEYV